VNASSERLEFAEESDPAPTRDLMRWHVDTEYLKFGKESCTGDMCDSMSWLLSLAKYIPIYFFTSTIATIYRRDPLQLNFFLPFACQTSTRRTINYGGNQSHPVPTLRTTISSEELFSPLQAAER